jgi:succinoglycan biosynthesis protein ExoV
MPHHQSMPKADWASLCERVGFHCIDARKSVETVVRELQETELLLTESMHGAIVADALRVPWVPVRLYPRFTLFKWQDWTQSMQLPLKIYDVQPVYARSPAISKRLTNTAKRSLAAIRIGNENWSRLETRSSTEQETSESLETLERIAREVSGTLSSEVVSKELENTLLEKLNQLLLDWRRAV